MIAIQGSFFRKWNNWKFPDYGARNAIGKHISEEICAWMEFLVFFTTATKSEMQLKNFGPLSVKE